jgi:4-diphosphocytidyl-2-C-methyl-D-erythritol kinase
MAIDSPMALAWGRGERLLPLPVLDRRPLVVLIPPFAVSTKEAYGWLAHDRGTYDARSGVLLPTELDTWEGIVAVAVNEFEPVVSRRHPAIAAHVEALREAGALPAMMSGSGSAVFGVFGTTEAALVGIASATAAGGEESARGMMVWTADRVERVETST